MFKYPCAVVAAAAGWDTPVDHRGLFVAAAETGQPARFIQVGTPAHIRHRGDGTADIPSNHVSISIALPMYCMCTLMSGGGAAVEGQKGKSDLQAAFRWLYVN